MSVGGTGVKMDENECPLCAEEFDVTDRNFEPCECGYKACTVATLRSCFVVIHRGWDRFACGAGTRLWKLKNSLDAQIAEGVIPTTKSNSQK